MMGLNGNTNGTTTVCVYTQCRSLQEQKISHLLTIYKYIYIYIHIQSVPGGMILGK